MLFVIMAILPWVLLNKKGRKALGIRKPEHPARIVQFFILGVFACALVFFIGRWLFFDSYNNWFIYLSKAYTIRPEAYMKNDRFVYFIVFALIGMTFSPIGEELLYRGLIHESFADKTGHYFASLIDSGAFAVTHLAHFGIVYIEGGWKFLLLPAILWVLLMFLISRLFYFARQKTGSILGAIVCHAAFNVTMAWIMIYVVLF
jgi:membrane protease YdiL (CAAX protease family)